MQIFETARLTVRRFAQEDAEDFYRFNSHPVVMQYIRPVKNRTECDVFLTENLNLYQPGSCLGRYFVADKHTGHFVGTFSLLYMSGTDDIHIGYGLMPECWGRGYAVELLKAGIEYFFNNTKRAAIFAITEPANTASCKVLEKAGFMRKASVTQQQKPLDLFYMNREDYKP
ncbi:GNAT family N-acetyltransferase [Asinibacterium sp. OR53]|uniref:GNAT family N-acetyltransferase n=1 Tax=Asinibacterium sp. OR53 TaxID=925409 RepID=UPI000A037A8C|nr:GNAT family N-acetyltransferase [Asinibacterium sp. OR53]